MHALNLQIAGRYEDIENAGTTLNPKYGVRWQPFKPLLVRGSYGTGFRAPAPTEFEQPEITGPQNVFDPRRGECYSVQVTTGAIDASTPLGSGAVVNVSTKSGTDTLKGVVGAVYTPEAWNGNNAGEGTVRFNEMFQPDLSLGGPILKGRLWFYGAYRYTRQFSGIGRSADQLALLKALKPTFEPFNNSLLSHNYYAKLTGSLSSKHQWVAFYERDTHPEGGDREWYTEPLDVTSAGGTGIGVRLQSVWGSSLTSRVMGSYNDKSTNSSFDNYDRPSTSTRGRSSRAAGSQEPAWSP